MTTLNADPCLAEALDYFNEIPLDDIFQKDFALVFDAGEVTPDVPSTTAYPAAFEQHTAHYHGQSLPMPIMSSHEVQPASVTSQTYTPAPATVTPNLPQKPVFSQQPIQSGEVSPATVATSVFEAPAQPKTAASTSSYNTSAPRKRSYSSMTIESTSAVAASATVTPIDDTSKLTFQQQKDLRRERNRHHAKRSRERKRNYMQQVEEAVNEMRKENDRLFKLLDMDNASAKAKLAEDEECKKAESTERFIAALKIPRNRVLDNTTHAFLKELWK